MLLDHSQDDQEMLYQGLVPCVTSAREEHENDPSPQAISLLTMMLQVTKEITFHSKQSNII